MVRIFTTGILLLLGQLALAATSLSRVSLDAPVANAARVHLQLSAAPRHKVFTLENPHRVVIDLSGAAVARGLRLPTAGGPVRTVRTGTQPDGVLRVVLVLNQALSPTVTVSGTQLTIELGKMPRVDAPPREVRAAHAPAEVGRDIIVAVDAGHGGNDPGATGAAGTREKDVVLAIARDLARQINAEPGMRAVLTRDSDTKIELRERINRARRAKADIFISVHADAIKDRSVAGSSVYVLSEKGATDEAAALLARQENAVDLNGGISLGGMNEVAASMLLDVSQATSISYSMDAASKVLAQLDKVGTVRKSSVRQAGFLVLKSHDIPSMLVETAYISNPGEEKNLRSAAHQAKIAAAIFKGVREYFRESPPDGTLFAQLRSGAGAIVAGGSGP